MDACDDWNSGLRPGGRHAPSVADRSAGAGAWTERHRYWHRLDLRPVGRGAALPLRAAVFHRNAAALVARRTGTGLALLAGRLFLDRLDKSRARPDVATALARR